ncbi:MAG: hypothetical protein GVY19_08680 [Bacteroidetes bacterium]|jgi:WD40 repeat protein|nr:hypothetical protein [Bacteroidota bacterium]
MKLKLLFSLTLATINAFSQQDEDYLLFEIKSHKEVVNTVSFNNNGNLLASGGEDKAIFVHNIKTQDEIAEIEDNYFPVKELQFLKDDNIIFTSGNALKIIDQQNNLIHTYPQTNTHIMDFTISANAKYMSAGTYYKKVNVWDFVTGEEVYQLEGHEKSVPAVGLSAKGKYLATGSLDKTIKVWGLDSGNMVHSMPGHADNIFAIAFHPENQDLFVSASGDNYLRLWSIDSGRTIEVYSGHDRAVVDAKFTPDGHFIISAGYDNTVRVWETASGEEIYTFATHKDAVTDVAVSKDGKYLASASKDETVMVWKFLPYIVVDSRMPNEIFESLQKEPLFDPRRDNESRQDYQSRMEKATAKKEEIYWKLYNEYITTLDNQGE